MRILNKYFYIFRSNQRKRGTIMTANLQHLSKTTGISETVLEAMQFLHQSKNNHVVPEQRDSIQKMLADSIGNMDLNKNRTH